MTTAVYADDVRNNVNGAWQDACRAHLAGDFPAAARAYQRVLDLIPKNRAVAAKAALMAHHFRKHDEAKRLLAWYLEAYPEDGDQWYNLGKFRHDNGETLEAVAHYQHALLIRPSIEALSNLGLCYAELGQTADAEAAFDMVLTMNAESAEARFNRAFVRLSRGDYTGWADYEARFECASFQWSHERSDLEGPRWTGDALWPGAVLPVHCEQGMGDIIQFARFVPQVLARVPDARVVLEVPGELLRLFRATWPALEIVQRGLPLAPYDATVSLLSLPAVFGCTLATIPAPIRFVVPPASLDAEALRAAAAGRPRVGLCWAGGKSHPNDMRRSLPNAAAVSLLRAVDGVAWYSLQVGERESQLAEIFPTLPAGSTFARAGTAFRDYADTAALIQALDLVITADTSVAHLAASLGVPTWILLQTPSEWRWMKGLDVTPWYPAASLIRQDVPREWDAIVARLAAALAALANTVPLDLSPLPLSESAHA